mgnify:CR=1 FL=1
MDFGPTQTCCTRGFAFSGTLGGRSIGEHVNYSQDMAQAIDEEIERLVRRAHDRARRTLVASMDRLHAVAARLIEVETIDRTEFEVLVAAEPVPEAAPA